MRIGRRNRRNRGISLLSAILALFLLTAAFTLATTSLVAGLRASRASHELTLASQVLEAEMERLRAEPFRHLKNGTRPLECRSLCFGAAAEAAALQKERHSVHPPIANCELRIADFPDSRLRNPQSAIRNPQSAIRSVRSLPTELPEARGEVRIEDYRTPGVKQLTVQLQWRSRTGPPWAARLVTLRSQ